METETPTSRAAPSGGSALPVAGAEHREALTRYAAQLLEGAAGQAGEIVEAALAQAGREAGGPGDHAPAREGEAEGDGEAAGRVVEKLFASVRRQALARLRREGIAQRTAVAEGEDAGASLEQRVGRLTPKQREAVWLKFSHGFGYEAIAGITGLSVRNVSFLLHSALTNLREAGAAADDDVRVTAYVLGEMREGERAAFEDAMRNDAVAKAAVGEVRTLAGELRGVLDRGDQAARRSKKKRRGAGAGFWRTKWFYAGVAAVVVGVVGWVAWVSRREAKAGQDVAREAQDFRMKPDLWKLAVARAEREGREVRAGAAGGSASPRKVAKPVGGDEKIMGRPPETDERGVVVTRGGAAAGGSAAVASGTGAPEGGGRAAPSLPGTPDGAAGAGPAGRDGGPVKDEAGRAGDGARAEPAASGAKTAVLRSPAAGGGDGKGGAKTSGAKPVAAQRGDGASAREAAGAANDAKAAATTRVEGEARAATLREAIAAKRGSNDVAGDAGGLLDYFSVEAAAPAEGPAVAVTVEVADSPWSAERKLVRVVVTAAPPVTARQAKANVVLLIDVSASMDAPNRLPLVREAARRLLHALQPEDRVAIVAYAGEARVALPSTPVAQAGAIRAALAALVPEGQTNGGAGLRRAYDVARAGFVAGGVNRVVLCTDGDFNMGVTSERELAALVETEARGGVGLAVLGFGRGREIDPRLEALAAKGRGSSGEVNTRREAERRMAAEVNGWRGAVARDVRVDFASDPKRVAGSRLVGREESFLPAEVIGRRSVEASELAPGETVTALFEVVPVRSGQQGGRSAEAWLTVRVGYVAVGAEGGGRELSVPVTDQGRVFAEASAGFKFSAAVAGLALALHERPVSPERLAAVVTWAEATAGDRAMRDPGGYREEFLALAREARELASSREGRE